MKKTAIISFAAALAVAALPVFADTIMPVSSTTPAVTTSGTVTTTGSTGTSGISVGVPVRFMHTLTIGSTGADVTQLQILLNKTPTTAVAQAPRAGSAGHETAAFGPATAAAVARYQTAHSIPSTGIVGPLTRASLNELLASYQTALPTVVSFVADVHTQGTALLTAKFDGGGEKPTVWFAYGVAPSSMTILSPKAVADAVLGSSQVTISNLGTGTCWAQVYVQNSLGTTKSDPLKCTQ